MGGGRGDGGEEGKWGEEGRMGGRGEMRGGREVKGRMGGGGSGVAMGWDGMAWWELEEGDSPPKAAAGELATEKKVLRCHIPARSMQETEPRAQAACSELRHEPPSLPFRRCPLFGKPGCEF